jgi:hypothetical protein
MFTLMVIVKVTFAWDDDFVHAILRKYIFTWDVQLLGQHLK